ncbi:hypothetical protein [Mesotoga prima]|uniref:phage major capsid protein n=1 Tax=Mesotoga prima TaxID=1184387 RepID=UPI002FD9439D
MPNKFDVLLKYKEKISDAVVDQMQAKSLEDAYKDSGLGHIADSIKLDSNAELLKTIIENNGYVNPIEAAYDFEGSNKITFQDIATSPDFSLFFPKVVSKMIIESWDVAPTLTGLLEYAPFQGNFVRIPAISAMGQNLDLQEGAEPPELTYKFGGWEETVIGKAGVAVGLTDETIRYSNFPVLNILIREAARALLRWKEYKTAQMILGVASTVQDGGSGVNAAGTENDGLIFDDIIKAMMDIVDKGGNPDLMIINPMAYQVFLLNPSLRSFFFNKLAGVDSPYNFSGVSFNKTAEDYGSFTQRTPYGRQVGSISFPDGVFGRPMKIVLSPFIPFASETSLTSIVFADSTQLGYLVQEQAPTAISERENLRMLEKFAIVERYSVVPKNRGTFINKITGVYAGKSFDPVPYYQINPQ